MLVTQEVIPEAQLQAVASSLEWYCRWVEQEDIARFHQHCSSADREKPSLQQVFWVYAFLPSNHPLRGQFDTQEVCRGYRHIVLERQQRRSCESLRWYQNFAEERIRRIK